MSALVIVNGPGDCRAVIGKCMTDLLRCSKYGGWDFYQNPAPKCNVAWSIREQRYTDSMLITRVHEETNKAVHGNYLFDLLGARSFITLWVSLLVELEMQTFLHGRAAHLRPWRCCVNKNALKKSDKLFTLPRRKTKEFWRPLFKFLRLNKRQAAMLVRSGSQL